MARKDDVYIDVLCICIHTSPNLTVRVRVRVRVNPYGLKRVVVGFSLRGAAAASWRNVGVARQDDTHIYIHIHTFLNLTVRVRVRDRVNSHGLKRVLVGFSLTRSSYAWWAKRGRGPAR